MNRNSRLLRNETVHDNPSLVKAIQGSSVLYPVFCLDPHFVKSGKVGTNRMQFLLQSLSDLDKSLMDMGSRLIVLQGQPRDELRRVCKEWGIQRLAFETDTEPYAIMRDEQIASMAKEEGVELVREVGHTLCDPQHLLREAKGKPTTTYGTFCTHFNAVVKKHPIKLVPTVTNVPPLGAGRYNERLHSVPSLKQLGYDDAQATTPLMGGEREALARMERYMSRTQWVAEFEKPKTSPAVWDMADRSTTVLSPYIKFGCLSSRTFYLELKKVYAKAGKHTQPPVSLEGQMLWREFYYVCSAYTPNFDKMAGNPICRQIPWGSTAQHDEMFAAWKEGRTGYPWIDACMIQLKQEGHIHHLARHAVACFLTRGDLWVSWEKGAEWFDEVLLDADWALNNGNWMWLSASCFFYQYFRCYSPVAFPKKYDPEGNFVKKYLPVLKKMPSKYIYEPWKAPIATQKEAGCRVGVDYPKPIVMHDVVSKDNMGKMKLAYDAHKAAGGGAGEEGDDQSAGEGPEEGSGKRGGAAGGGKSKAKDASKSAGPAKKAKTKP